MQKHLFTFQKVFFIICFGCFSFLSFGQIITGEIKDIEGNKISLVNVQLLEKESNKIISFSQSNKNGLFSIHINESKFPLILKIQHLSFETKIIEVNNLDFVNIILKSRINELQEIVIEAKSYDVVKRGDTLTYNLKNLMDGSELKLKDFIDKLPGFSIDEDGKIRYNGVILNHLLIEGNEFFGNKHQIANENITAEMIENLELITNYKGLSNIKDFDNSGKLALNIGIKDKFKNAFKGNLTTEGGVDKRYFLNGHFFNFGKKTLFSIVTNTNNINQNILTSSDYLEFRNSSGKKMINQGSSQKRNSSNFDLPSFLFATDDSKSRKLSNITANFTHKFRDNEKLEFVSVFNYLNQNQVNFTEQIFFDTNINNASRSREIIGKSNYFSNTFKYEKKFTNNSYFNINAYSLISKDIQNQNIKSAFSSNSNLIFNQDDLDLNTNKFGFNALFKKNIDKKWLLELGAFYDYNKSKIDKYLFASNTFSWLDSQQTDIFQNSKLSNNDLGAQASLKYKWKENNLSIQFFTELNEEQLINDIENLNAFKFNNSYKSNENSLNLQFSGLSTKSSLVYGLGLKFNNVNHIYKYNEKKTINVILPNAYFAYNFSSKFNSSVSYSANLSGFSIYNFLTGNIVNDYRTYLGVSQVIPESMISDSYSLGFSYNFVEENIFSSLTISRTNIRKNLQKTFLNSDVFAEEIFQYQDLNTSTSIMFALNKKFYQIPYAIRFNSYGTSSNFNTSLNGSPTENKNYNLFIDLNLRSYYKNSFLNYSIGLSYMNNSNINSFDNQQTKLKLERITPFLNFNGSFLNKKLVWNMESKYYIYEATSIKTTNIFDFGFKTQYNFNEKFQFYINAKNILNIRNHNTKNNFTSTSYYSEEIIMHTLSGFINTGVIFSF